VALLLAMVPAASATELLMNRSFDQNGAYWMVAPGGTNDSFFAVTGEANLHGANGYLSANFMWQDLDVPNVGGASGTASITMNKMSAPPGNTISIYVEYTDSSGNTNSLLLLTPANNDVLFLPSTSTFTTNFTLPADAQRIVRFVLGKTYYGDFRAQEFSLDVATASPPGLGLSIVNMSDGDTNTIPFALHASVTNGAATVSSVVFYANGVAIGSGSLDPLGEWTFPDTSRFSVMGYSGRDMVDYTSSQADMYFMNGHSSSLYDFSGMFQYFGGGSMSGGPVSIVYTISPDDHLTAAITAAAPLGNVTLTNGVRGGDIHYGYFWQSAAPGQYAITASAVYNGSLTETSAPVNITVIAAVPIPSLQILQTTPTQVELSWQDNGVSYILNTKTSLTDAYWDSTPGVPILNDGRYFQTISVTNKTGFFSLRKL